ncbi:MAG: 2-phospho-L-lactate guanylyltransferase [Dehalococcoidia bacterium]
MIAALVPAKTLSAAKGRLAELLSEDERRRLALAMLEDVLAALAAVPRLASVTVVSPDREALDRARSLGADAIEEPPSSRGINQALSHASAELVARGADSLLVLVADLPGVLPADLEAVLDALPERGIALVPTDDRGTGALALRPPGVITFRYGRHSSVLHKREAAARGIPARVLHLDSLAHDVDEPSDLERLLATPADLASSRLLHELGVAGRLAAGRPV